jgi:hypothetical protein
MPLELGAGGQSHSSAIYPGEKILGTHRTGGWVESRAVLDECKKILPSSVFETRTVRPVVDLLREKGEKIAFHFTQRDTYFVRLDVKT